MLTHTVCGEKLTLLPEKAVWWDAQKMLVIADLHLGKSMHFRKAGIPMPLISQHKDFTALEKLLQTNGLEQVVFLGDLFHSAYNSDWEILGEIVNRHRHLRWILVQGNHDILQESHYRRFGFEVFDCIRCGPFILSHEEQQNPDGYNIFGHIHPGVKLEGKGRQSLRLPCFFFTENWAVLPSFGKLTGLYSLYPKKTDCVFVVANGKVMRMN